MTELKRPLGTPRKRRGGKERRIVDALRIPTAVFLENCENALSCIPAIFAASGRRRSVFRRSKTLARTHRTIVIVFGSGLGAKSLDDRTTYSHGRANIASRQRNSRRRSAPHASPIRSSTRAPRRGVRQWKSRPRNDIVTNCSIPEYSGGKAADRRSRFVSNCSAMSRPRMISSGATSITQSRGIPALA